MYPKLRLLTFCLLWRAAMTQNSLVIHGPGLVRSIIKADLDLVVVLEWQVDGLDLSACAIKITLGEEIICTIKEQQIIVNEVFGSYSCSAEDGKISLTMFDDLQRATQHKINLELQTVERTYTDSASFFLYRRPEVRLELPPNITESDTVLMSCVVSLTSIPEWARLPVSITWHIAQIFTDYVIGNNNVTLTIYNVRRTDEDISCTATEADSLLSATATTQLHIQDKSESLFPPVHSLSTGMIGMLSGGAVFPIALVVIIAYLLWERKHRPKRQDRRSVALRRSLGRSWLQVHSNQNTSNLDKSTDSENIYSEIRMSRLHGVNLRRLPALPEHVLLQQPQASIPLENTDQILHDKDKSPKKSQEQSAARYNTGALEVNTAAVRDSIGALEVNTAAVRDNTGSLEVNTAAVRDNTGSLEVNTAAVRDSTGALEVNTGACRYNSENARECVHMNKPCSIYSDNTIVESQMYISLDDRLSTPNAV